MKFIDLGNGRFAVVDDADFAMLAEKHWYAIKGRNSWYAYTTWRDKQRKKQYESIHRMILGLTRDDSRIVDHKDGNGLNNQRSNIRPCTRMQNSWNSDFPHPNNSSGHRGVVWDKRRRQWRWIIHCAGRSYSHGPYRTPLEAAFARDKKAAELYGEFAKINIARCKA